MAKIRLGYIALSFHAASAAVVQWMLEAAGHEVVVSSAPHAEMFERFGRDEVDLLISAWLPASHGAYLAPLADRAIKLGVLYEPYCIWGVPDYVPADAVTSVGDLLKPDVAARMSKLIQGINPGAGISRFSQQMILEYGLDAIGYQFRPGSEVDCFGRFEAAVAAGDWLVVPLWHPQYLHHRHRIRALVEPRGLLGGRDEATLILHRAAQPLFSQQLIADLTALHIGNEAISMMDHHIWRDGMTPRDAASLWWRDYAATHGGAGTV